MTEHIRPDPVRWELLCFVQGKLFSILDSMEDGVYIINQQYQTEYVNPTLQAGLGPVGGRKCYQYFHNREEPCPRCEYNEVVLTGQTYRREWYSAMTQRTYDLISGPLINADGSVSKLGIFRDITERKKAEKELKKYRGHLEELVEKRTTELTAVNKKLEQEISRRKCMENKLEKLYSQEKELRCELESQMKQRIEFTRALVHEIKTPLTALLAASDLLAVGIKEEPYATLVSNIQLGTLTLDRRIRELLDLARGEVGTLQLKCRPMDLLQLLQEMADYVTPEAAKKQQSLVLDLPPSLPIIQGDRDRLQQVLLNLLNNAFKFTLREGRVTVKARQEDSTLVVEVQDTGPGISKEKQKRLFKPYYKQESDEEQFSGLGLGLALCKTLVQLHGGKIWVESHEANGSTFGFSLPAEKQHSV